MSSPEFTEWMAFYSLEPWGNVQDEYQAGIVSATIANVNRKKGSKAYRATDFFPIRGEKKKAQSQEELKSVLIGLVKSTKGKKRAKKKKRAKRKKR